MLLIPVIIDAQAPGCPADERSESLLGLPLGCGTVLDHLLAALAPVEHGDVIILTRAAAGHEYHERLHHFARAHLQILNDVELAARLRRIETSDCLLAIEPRYWPLAGYNFHVLDSEFEYRGATHAVGVGGRHRVAREVVECDSDGQVKRIQRYFRSGHWPEVANSAIAWSIVPAPPLREISFDSLGQLRTALAASGTLSRDYPLESEIVDLAQASAYLALQERITRGTVRESPPTGYAVHSTEVLVGTGCYIDSTARLVPPVIVHPGARVESDATVVGPCTIGCDCVVGSGAAVAHSVLAAGTHVESESVVCDRLVLANGVTRPDLDDAYANDLACEWIDEQVSESTLANLLVRQGLRRRVHLAMKRGLDIALSAIGLLLLSPLLATVAALVKMDSRGPVFFGHRRERMGGKEFTCWKFRTMVADAHIKQRELYARNEVDGPQFKMRHDPRITRVGRFLRATNIDELPQLFNVLLGHMSLVGPRPSPFRENQICVPWRMARLSVRPGITGLWQICRGSATEGFHEWIHYDILYVRHFSIWLDLRIILATVLSLCGRYNIPPECVVPQAGGAAVNEADFRHSQTGSPSPLSG